MGVRKNVKDLSAQEKQDFVAAVFAVKASGKYNRYVKMHVDAMATATPASEPPSFRNAAHRGPAFLPWHREFLRQYESDLNHAVAGVTLPYWDWATDAALANPATGAVWGTDLLGGDGDASDGDSVKTGPFAFDPSNPNGWTVADSAGNDTGLGLRRNFGASVATLPTQAEVNAALARVPYDTDPWNTASDPSFRNQLEGWLNGPALHNRVHVWVGGSMLPGTSPNDPVFFLHHCFVDKLWADWQREHPDEPYVPDQSASSDLQGHRIHDAMSPWQATPATVLDHHALGYTYDTEAKGEFEIRRSKDDQFYFVLQAANNEIVAVSEMYTAKASAKNGIDAVKRLATTAPINDTTL